MSSVAQQRAEARRKALLARGTDRLSKLTTSARGEDAPQFIHDDPPDLPLPNRPVRTVTQPSQLENFVGEGTAGTIPTNGTPNPFDAMNDPNMFSSEMQQQMMRMFMGGGAPDPAGIPSAPGAPVDDPFAALMQSLQAGGPPGAAPGGFPGMGFGPPPPKPRTLLHKLLPLIHLLSVWALVGYFVFWFEPQVSGSSAGFSRWASLISERPRQGAARMLGVQPMPFFYAFITLELCLHSLRIFIGLDAVQPPMLLALAIPHLPPPLPTVITHGLKYIKMIGALLDDLAAAIVALALCAWIASVVSV
ncbi:hypothetical protein PENSPDRAFT_659057 [Peniophora sp. CONT]|nr:hypothetical protein PENSPDRAFT_659057 [Peniophora sp. CONT]